MSSNCSNNNNSFSIINFATVNINSLSNKLHSVYNFACVHNLRIFSITETWLIDECSTSFVDISGYEFHRRDVRGCVRKHGTGVSIAEGIKCLKIDIALPNLVVVSLVDFAIIVVSILVMDRL